MGRTVKDIVVGIAGVIGLLAITWLALSIFFGFTLIVFRTGSMSPSMPTGAAAIAVPVSAAQIEVGDVLTVDRGDGKLPITHRVVGIEPDPGNPEGRLVTMRGDANDIDDRAPYEVTEAMRVVASAPGVGTALVQLRQPPMLAATTLLLAGIVTWGFWPARETEKSPKQESKEHVHADA
ncbi:S26 family signal peptidase [Demequina aurantiaca]|uniref:S26 family signal peptidase n=1 Tax=Demequina aurantiaca TaxID=676200 RepID=UPI003D32D52C